MKKAQVNDTSSKCLSAYALDAARLAGGKIPEHVSGCRRCSAAWQQADLWDLEFHTSSAPRFENDVIVRALKEKRMTEKTDPAAGLRVRWVIFAPMAAAALIIAVVGAVLLHRPPTPLQGGVEYIGDKGAVGLEIWCKRNDRVFRVNQGDRLRPEDRLRFVPRFAAGTSLFVMVVSVDGRGTISRYYPDDDDKAVKVTKSGEPLPGSTILDTTPGFERVWLLASSRPFDFAEARLAAEAEARRAGSVDRMGALPMAVGQATVLFAKETR